MKNTNTILYRHQCDRTAPKKRQPFCLNEELSLDNDVINAPKMSRCSWFGCPHCQYYQLDPASFELEDFVNI